MKIGIDVSQVVYEKTGVSRYVGELVRAIITASPKTDFVLLGVSWGRRRIIADFFRQVKIIRPDIRCILLPVPLSLMDFVWNRLHILPIDLFTGKLDVFWSSDWIQPPVGRAIGVTTIHDLSFMYYPDQTDKLVLETHRRRLKWVKKECSRILCDSQVTKNDVNRLLKIDLQKLTVVYPGYSL
jgi:glycosyltransferase involved in cell wall biosynthesis